MNNFKIQQLMKDKKTPKTEAEKAGMATLLARVRELRERASNKVAPDGQNTSVNGRTMAGQCSNTAKYYNGHYQRGYPMKMILDKV